MKTADFFFILKSASLSLTGVNPKKNPIFYVGIFLMLLRILRFFK